MSTRSLHEYASVRIRELIDRYEECEISCQSRCHETFNSFRDESSSLDDVVGYVCATVGLSARVVVGLMPYPKKSTELKQAAYNRNVKKTKKKV